MALAAASVFEVRTGGSDTNGGGFVTGASGVDYSQTNSARTGTGSNDSTTDAVANGTTTITSATANFTADIVGNIIYLQGGSGGLAAGRYQVTARSNATTITVDRSVAAGTGITMNIGGAVASLGILGSSTATGLVADNTIWIQAGTYSITTASTNVSNGCLSTSVRLRIEGYNSSRGDLGTAPLLQASGAISSFSIIATSSNPFGIIRNINVDGASKTSSRGFTSSGGGIWDRCGALNCTNSGFSATNHISRAIRCYTTGCATQPTFLNVDCHGCIAYDNSITGFRAAQVFGPTTFTNCVSDSNTGASTDGFDVTGGTTGFAVYINCVAYGNGRHGFNTGQSCLYVNCIAESNTSDGFGSASPSPYAYLQSCAYYNNGTNVNLHATAINESPVTGSGSFFTDAANGDFSLNNTSGAGAAARGAGYPGVLGSSTGYADIGAFQHQDSGGGGGSSEHAFTFFG